MSFRYVVHFVLRLAAAYGGMLVVGGRNHEPQINPGTPAAPITPMVYVREKTAWEYKLLTRNLAKEEAPSEEELNTLGQDGWELAGIVTDHPIVRFYFKRLKD